MTCQVCGRAEHQCRMVDAKMPIRARHDYLPGRPAQNTLVAPAHVRTPAKGKAPRGWRDRTRGLCPPPQPTLMDGQDQ